MTKPPELKPCPFCGGEAYIDGTSWTTINGEERSWVTCRKCRAYGPSSAKSIAAWNTRTPDLAVQALVEAARPFADIGVSQNPDWQPTIRLDRDAILALRAALAAFDKT